MAKVLRSVAAIPLGLVAGMLVIIGCEAIGHHLYPPEPGVDLHNMKSSSVMPAGAFVPILVAWAFGTFAGSWVATKVAVFGKTWQGMAIGGFVLAATVAIMLQIPHPVWVMVVGLVSPLPVAYLGTRLANPRPGPKTPIQEMV